MVDSYEPAAPDVHQNWELLSNSGGLLDRLRHAHRRKVELSTIFQAIDVGDFPTAIQLSLQRYQAQSNYWLYAGRLAAELMMRERRFDEAQQVYRSIVARQPLPWARLGVARSLLDMGNTDSALADLSALAEDQPAFADTHDVLMRLHLDNGRLADALAAAKRAASLTPGSVDRLQRYGMMAYYQSDFKEAARALDRATLLGLTSKLFDPQALMLLVFPRLQLRDAQGIKRGTDQIQKLIERHDSPIRLLRFKRVAETLLLLVNKQLAAVIDRLKDHAQEIRSPEFDVEAACNFLTLCSEVARTEVSLESADEWVQTLALRFCTSISLTGLLATAAARHPPYEAAVRTAHQHIGTLAKEALAKALDNRHAEAVHTLLEHGNATLNLKLLETARVSLYRHRAHVADATALEADIQAKLDMFTPSCVAPPMGQSRGRTAGGLTLRTSAEAPVIKASVDAG